LNTDFTFGGSIVASGTKFEKIGTGTMTVTGSSDFTGTALISEGALCLNRSNGSSGMLGQGTLTVASGAKLCGAGALTNSSVVINDGGMLRPGVKENSISGVLNFTGKKLVVNNGATVKFYLGSRTLYTRLNNVDVMTLRGTVQVGIRDGVTFEEGTEFQLWSSNNTQISELATFELASPGEGLAWDITDIESGIIRVAKETSVEDISVNQEVLCVVYGIDGVECARFTCLRSNISNMLHAEGMSRGIYLVSMNYNDTKIVEKFIVE
jgi:autotransporter-associated beta strand protein